MRFAFLITFYWFALQNTFGQKFEEMKYLSDDNTAYKQY